MPCAAPFASERVFPKTTNSPFVETDLEKVIRELRVDRLVIVGLMTAHCVSTTLRAASNLRVVDHSYGCTIKPDEPAKGEIILVEDATATFNVVHDGKEYDAETVHAVHLASLKDEFCDLMTTMQVLELLGHPSS